jgi:hypothetical protein
MPKQRKRKPAPWEIIAITRSPARYYGVVYEADEQETLAKAIDQQKLMARPQR